MERSPLSTLAVLGVVGTLLLVVMYLFAMQQVADPAAARMATEIAEEFGDRVASDPPPRVVMYREGKGMDAPRRYVVRFHPLTAAEAPSLAGVAADIVLGHLDAVRAPCMIHCVAELAGAPEVERCFRRTGSDGIYMLEPVVPVPTLPAAGPHGEEDARR